MEKMTKRDYFNRILAYAHEEDKAFIVHELELLEKKNASRANKPTKTQQANAELIEAIYNTMEYGKTYTVTDLMTLVPELEGLKVQKVSALVKKMKDSILVSRELVKGKAYFSKV